MGLRGIFAEALPDIFEAAAEVALFTPAVGDAIPCMVFIDFNVELQPSGADAQVWQQGTTIEALLSSAIGIGIGDREPNRGETFTVFPDATSRTAGINGTTYAVQAILENDGLTVKMVVT